MTVYDTCMFLNENDLYEIRLNQHWDFVDKFIVVEVGETHTGLKKPLKFDHERFKPYAEKLVYVTFDSFEEEMKKFPELLDTASEMGVAHVKADWTRDRFQFNYMYKAVKDLGAVDSDIVYFSCLDEIIKKEAFDFACTVFSNKSWLSPHGLRPIMFFQFYLYAYKMNLLYLNWNEHYAGTITEFGNFKKVMPAVIRNHTVMTHPPIPDGGWHFTFLDNTDGEMVLEKQRSWAHSKDKYEGRKTKFDHVTKEEALARFFEDYKVKKVEITEQTHPKYILDNLDKFQDFIYKEELK